MIYMVTHLDKEELLQLIDLSRDNGVTSLLFSTEESAERYLDEVYKTRRPRGLRIVKLSITDVSAQHYPYAISTMVKSERKSDI
jgi:hypothetical protein